MNPEKRTGETTTQGSQKKRWIVLPQERESRVQEIQGTGFSYRYAYARSADTQKEGDVGQDYLAIVEGDHSLVFALCDGVSQSFYGDLAARVLGESLAE